MDDESEMRKCACGTLITLEEKDFWGECKKCRLKPAIQTQQRGDDGDSGSGADRRFHGGTGSRGEW